jgi:hypothetical protein
LHLLFERLQLTLEELDSDTGAKMFSKQRGRVLRVARGAGKEIYMKDPTERH